MKITLCMALSAAALAVAIMAFVEAGMVDSRLDTAQKAQAEALYLRCVTVGGEVKCHAAMQTP